MTLTVTIEPGFTGTVTPIGDVKGNVIISREPEQENIAQYFLRTHEATMKQSAEAFEALTAANEELQNYKRLPG